MPDSTELPPPSAELVLFRVFVETHLATLSRKKGKRYLQRMAETLAAEESMTSVLSIRPHAQQNAVRKARKQAAVLYERMLPVLLARLPRK